jgi:hypothetical protein
MKKTSSFETWLVIIIICIPAIYAASIYGSLPDTFLFISILMETQMVRGKIIALVYCWA